MWTNLARAVGWRQCSGPPHASVAARFARAQPFSGSAYAHDLGNLGPAPGSTRQQNRVGRGPGSGRGKTSGRGQKGQKARHSVKPWFEGGQTPITRLFPKVGFKSRLPELSEINLGTIQALIDAGRLDASKPITLRDLYRTKALDKVVHGVKLLGRGADQLKTPIKITASKASSVAIARIEELGGSYTAQYYNPLAVRALTRPEATLEKYARLPLPARPSDRRNIEYYREPQYRGYLQGAPGAPQVKAPYVRANKSVSPLIERLRMLEQQDPSGRVVQGFETTEAVRRAQSKPKNAKANQSQRST